MHLLIPNQERLKNKHRILRVPAEKANPAKAFVSVVLKSGPLQALNNTQYKAPIIRFALMNVFVGGFENCCSILLWERKADKNDENSSRK